MNAIEECPTAVRAPLAVPGEPQDDSEAVLVVTRGPRCGRTFVVRALAVVGRGDVAAVPLGDLGISRRHATVLLDERRCWSIKDLGSKNGTRVNGERVLGSRELEDGDRIALGADTVLAFCRGRTAAGPIEDALMEQARRDPLTGALNRRSFEEELTRDFAYARRHDEPLALLLLELDDLQRGSDDGERAAGDTVLMALSTVIRLWVREGDPVARFGDRTFAILFRGVSGQRAVGLATRLKCAVADKQVRVACGERVALTVSVGIATYPGGAATTAGEVLAAAERALRLAKARGWNCIALAEEASP